MQGNLFVTTFHVHGTLSADAIFHYKLPCDATLVQVDTTGVANVTSAVIVGNAADDDGYIKTFTPGANNNTVTKRRGDFDGALNPDPAECPHITKDTVILITFTHASASHVDIALTFTEG